MPTHRKGMNTQKLQKTLKIPSEGLLSVRQHTLDVDDSTEAEVFHCASSSRLVRNWERWDRVPCGDPGASQLGTYQTRSTCSELALRGNSFYNELITQSTISVLD